MTGEIHTSPLHGAIAAGTRLDAFAPGSVTSARAAAGHAVA
jgi:hypothetical protein